MQLHLHIAVLELPLLDFVEAGAAHEVSPARVHTSCVPVLFGPRLEGFYGQIAAAAAAHAAAAAAAASATLPD